MSYKSRDQMLATWAGFASAHPDIVSVEKIGSTAQGRDILLYKIGNPNGGRVMFSSCTHCQERESVEVHTMFADWIVNSTDANAVRIRQRNCVLCIPLLNYDGFPTIANGMNHNAVNIYRNCDFRWGQELASHTPGYSCSNKTYTTQADCVANAGTWAIDWTIWTQYCGPSVESEPETKALKAAWLKYLPINYADLHCGGTAGGYGLWFSWIPTPTSNDNANLAKMAAVCKAYEAEATKEGKPIVYAGWGQNAGSSGCPVSAVYKVTGGKTLGYVNEVCLHNIPYADIVNTHFPNWKPLGIALCQASEAFILNISTNVLNLSTNIGGTTNPSAGQYLCDQNSTIIITAIPAYGYHLSGWKVDGTTLAPTNPLHVTMNGDHVIEVEFAGLGGGGGGHPLSTQRGRYLASGTR